MLIMDYCSLSLKVNYQGKVDMSVDLNTAIAQLIDPGPTKPVFLTGLRLPAVENSSSERSQFFSNFKSSNGIQLDGSQID